MQVSDLDRWLAERNLNGHWNRQARIPRIRPYLWKWADIYEGLQRAGELVPMDQTGRRTIQLRNPSLPGGMTHTIHLSVQMVKPGEIARAHRHVAGAIRYVIKGSPHGCTIVEGERFTMEEGDLITTPNWTWHDHYNGSDEPIIWLDGLDVRLVSYFGAQFQENFVQDQQPVEKPDGYSSKILGKARPTWMKRSFSTPPFRYRWQETYGTLLTLKESEGDPFDGVRLEYVNPFNGGPTLPTYSCEVQLLRPEEKTRSHRHTSTTVYHAIRGEGVTVVGEERLQWSQGDIFVVPPWYWHSHENRLDQDVILFSINDWPTMKALGLYREEAG
ncbi:MAG: cupin domain-containing protein [Deltaproteobacteria bacterium]|nr:cupin domain-containing protein [Deltaproteobacteria bacterium]MCZ6626201.1 cupin domain-containing protein [Deltaproteobacteria bacterium]